MIGNVVQDRLPMVSQLMEGLAPCGILAAIQANVSNIWLGFWLGNNQAFAPFTALAIV